MKKRELKRLNQLLSDYVTYLAEDRDETLGAEIAMVVLDWVRRDLGPSIHS